MRAALLAAALLTTAGAAAAQPAPAPLSPLPPVSPPIDPRIRETAGCAAVFMTMAQFSADPQLTGDNPLVGALAGALGRSWSVKGRALYAQAAEEARRQRVPPEAVFEAGVSYLMDAYRTARGATGGSVDLTLEAARLVQRCVVAFPDPAPDFG